MSREVLEKYRSELPLFQDTALFCISHPRSILSIHLQHGRHPDQDPVPQANDCRSRDHRCDLSGHLTCLVES